MTIWSRRLASASASRCPDQAIRSLAAWCTATGVWVSNAQLGAAACQDLPATTAMSGKPRALASAALIPTAVASVATQSSYMWIEQ